MNQAKFVDAWANTVEIIIVNLSEVCSFNLRKGTTVAEAVCGRLAGPRARARSEVVREMRGNIDIRPHSSMTSSQGAAGGMFSLSGGRVARLSTSTLVLAAALVRRRLSFLVGSHSSSAYASCLGSCVVGRRLLRRRLLRRKRIRRDSVAAPRTRRTLAHHGGTATPTEEGWAPPRSTPPGISSSARRAHGRAVSHRRRRARLAPGSRHQALAALGTSRC